MSGPFGFLEDVLGSGPVSFVSDLLLGERRHDQNVHSMERQMQFGAAQADKQMQFQERMRNSAYSAATSDMKRAGLNPMLAYQQGGAHAPAGSAASAGGGHPVEDSKAFSSAASVRHMQEQIQLLREQGNLVREDIRKRHLEGDVLEGPAALSRAAAGGAKALEDAGEPIRRSLTDAIEKVSTEVLPGIRSSAVTAMEAPGRAVKYGAEKGKAVMDVIRALPDHLKSMLFNSAGRVRGHIPPAERGKPMGKSRGKLGSARSWDYGPDAR